MAFTAICWAGHDPPGGRLTWASFTKASAPGPDRLGPSFYHATWEVVGGDMRRLFDAFHEGAADLAVINRAHVVLLPKCAGVPDPGSFRPVSLQNCPMKAVCKALTSRL